ncbi:MAG: thiamine phosphate synthase [Terriglobales bacterium]|jgi:thiamine-phosphate pyrophosphorylase
MLQLPRLYPIVDPACFHEVSEMFAAAEELAAAGCTLLQYRNKSGNARLMLDHARELRTRLGARADPELPRSPATAELRSAWTGEGARSHTSTSVKLIMNDRADLCLAASFDGVHVGQDDLSPEAVRKILGGALFMGVSTHNAEQLAEADRTSADYLAIGPVFATGSKENPDPVVGLEGVRRARELTRKPLVAIGGITRGNARSVLDAGADSVAVISDLIRDPGKSAEEFLRVLG